MMKLNFKRTMPLLVFLFLGTCTLADDIGERLLRNEESISEQSVRRRLVKFENGAKVKFSDTASSLVTEKFSHLKDKCMVVEATEHDCDAVIVKSEGVKYRFLDDDLEAIKEA